MYFRIILIVLLFFSFYIENIIGLSLTGNPQANYDPCGLAIFTIKNENRSANMWTAVFMLGIYSQLSEVDVYVVFDVPVSFETISNVVNITSTTKSSIRFVVKENVSVPIELDFKTDENNAFPTVNTFSLNNIVLCNDIPKVFEIINGSVKNFSDDNNVQICGRHSLHNNRYYLTNTLSKRGDWPWHVAIFLRKDNSSKAGYHCGGSIISRTAVVTGHCVTSENGLVFTTKDVFIFAGATNLNYVKDEGTQMRRTQQIILHPSYKLLKATADLAVVKIEKLIFTEFVQPICLWGPTFDKAGLYGTHGVFTGFGVTETNLISYDLRSTSLVVQEDNVCINYSQKLYQNLLNEFSFCAGYGPTIGITPLNGDSGGGLTFPLLQEDNKSSWFLRGVMSTCGSENGSSTCDEKYYVVFTDIGPHYTWLMHHAGLEYSHM